MSVKTSELNRTGFVMQYNMVSSENPQVPNPSFLPILQNLM